MIRYLTIFLLAILLLPPVQASNANLVLDWNALMLEAIRADNSGPTISTRNLAILHCAIYDAVNSIDRAYQPYQFQLVAPIETSAEAAVVAAAYEVMQTLYPSLLARIDDLYERHLAATPGTAAQTNGLFLGAELGRRTLESRRADGSTTQVPYIPGDGPGDWRRTPPFFRPPVDPHWRYVTPFCLTDIERFVPGAPPALNSPEYAAALNEVKLIGEKNSVSRTAEQTQIAVFWSDFSYTAMPPGHWHEIASGIAEDHHLGLFDTARLFALISLAQADSAIVCWEAKYRYNLWRPVTAILRADEDGNPDTTAKPDWQQLLGSPPFPSYMSGHSTFSKASATVLSLFFGTDALAFTTGSDSLPGVFRGFTSLSACVDEIGMSRVYGGIHFQFDNVEGKLCGRKIAEYVSGNFLLPNEALPSVSLESFSNGTPRLHIQAHYGARFVLESTSDFAAWSSLSTNVAAAGGVVLWDTPTFSRRFYRVREF